MDNRPSAQPTEPIPTPTPPAKIKHAHKFIFVYLALIVVIAAATVVYAWQYQKFNSLHTSPVTTFQSPPISKLFSIGNTKVQYINMPGLASFKAGNISSVVEQQGNYLYAIANPNTLCAECANPYLGQGELVYDGRIVYRGDLDNDQYFLSDNGLHYYYTEGNDSGNNTVFYTDKIKIVTDGQIYEPVAVSDSGQFFAYSTGSSSTTSSTWSIYKNSTLVYTTNSPPNSLLMDTDFSGDFSNYIATLALDDVANPVTTNIIFDGKIIATTSDPNLNDPSVNISENGEHYIYSSGGNVVVDGKIVATYNQVPYNDVITDDGAYAYSECGTNGVVFIGAQSFSTGSCNSQKPPVTSILTINSSGSQYFYFYGNKSNDNGILNGKSLKLSGQIDSAQFVGNTLDVYRWTY